jgi:NADH-quinone oxidoreductase subunit I
LFWSPEFEFSEMKIADMLHDKERLADWMHTVPEYPAYEVGAEVKVKKLPSPSS